MNIVRYCHILRRSNSLLMQQLQGCTKFVLASHPFTLAIAFCHTQNHAIYRYDLDSDTNCSGSKALAILVYDIDTFMFLYHFSNVSFSRTLTKEREDFAIFLASLAFLKCMEFFKGDIHSARTFIYVIFLASIHVEKRTLDKVTGLAYTAKQFSQICMYFIYMYSVLKTTMQC